MDVSGFISEDIDAYRVNLVMWIANGVKIFLWFISRRMN